MLLRLGRFLARSKIRTRVPISGPSTLMSAKMPAECGPENMACLDAMMEDGRCRRWMVSRC